jgi:plasmid maintenance system antidote protein VapI
MSAKAFAEALDVPGNRISAILQGKRESPPTQHCAYHATSAFRQNSG